MLDFTIYNFSISSFNSYVTETEWAHFMSRPFFRNKRSYASLNEQEYQRQRDILSVPVSKL